MPALFKETPVSWRFAILRAAIVIASEAGNGHFRASGFREFSVARTARPIGAHLLAIEPHHLVLLSLRIQRRHTDSGLPQAPPRQGPSPRGLTRHRHH